jgi:hypothetical protein
MHPTHRFLLAAAIISVTTPAWGLPFPAAIRDTAAANRPAAIADTGMTKARQTSPGPDTAAISRKKAAYDSLEHIRSEQIRYYMRYPASLDSLFSPGVSGPYRFMNSNATGLSEVLRSSPISVAAPVGLSNSQSRFMLYGFPLLTNGVYLDGNSFGESPDAIHGTDGILSSRLSNAVVVPPLGVECGAPPAGLVAPHTDVVWENGVFLENLLGVRFARPLTQTIDVGIYSNFRSLAPFNYTTAGDIKSFYGYFFRDTTMVANGGRNPLSNENEMTLSLNSHQSSTAGSSVSYSYVDSKNDQALQLFDSTQHAETLRWRTLARWANIFQGGTRGLSLSPLVSANVDGRAVVEGHRLYTPIVDSAIERESAGRNTDLCLGVEPYAAFGPETLSVAGRAERKDQKLYDGSEPVATIGDLRLGFRHGKAIGPLYASFALSAGDGAVKAAGKPLRGDLVYSARGTVSVGLQRASVFVLRDHLPFVLPYDSLGAPLASYNDAYEAYGADVFLGYRKVGLEAGVCAVTGVDTSLASRFWSDNSMPYRQPSVSFMLTPLFGRVLGFALSSRTLLSDKRPYVKSQTALSYQASPIFGREHITADLLFDYWSGRDTLSYAGINIWNREIFNVSLVTGVHIQGFCIFYKIDNILNRKYAYVPGYFMPGLTFRWGFQWLIPG